jgi:hypothetical protein
MRAARGAAHTACGEPQRGGALSQDEKTLTKPTKKQHHHQTTAAVTTTGRTSTGCKSSFLKKIKPNAPRPLCGMPLLVVVPFTCFLAHTR